MKIFTLFFCLITLPVLADSCHPEINPDVPQYVIGYGSLINEESKHRTDPTAEENLPVIIQGYQRIWGAYGNSLGYNATFLSVFKDAHASFNGVIYKLKRPEQITQYDKRESIYCRHEIDEHALKIYQHKLPSLKQIWIYQTNQNNTQIPTEKYPIVQSYVDIFLSGCLQIENKFKIKDYATQCITTTKQWSNHWVNDRIFPRRASLYQPDASRIDALLKNAIPEKFEQIKIE